MRARITGVDFTTNHQWVIKLEDSDSGKYFVMDSRFYIDNKRDNPPTELRLERIKIGMTVTISAEEVDGINIVTNLTGY